MTHSSDYLEHIVIIIMKMLLDVTVDKLFFSAYHAF